jgi:hypothetical protein
MTFTSLRLPLSRTGRKYGYITWKKNSDSIVRKFLGDNDSISIKTGNFMKQSRIDWKYRRIYISYSLTRLIPEHKVIIVLQKSEDNNINIAFE